LFPKETFKFLNIDEQDILIRRKIKWREVFVLDAEKLLARLCNLQDGSVQDVLESSANPVAQKLDFLLKSQHARTVESNLENKGLYNAFT